MNFQAPPVPGGDRRPIGMGLRSHHMGFWMAQETLPPLEVLADNYLTHRGGVARHVLAELAERTPLSLHSTMLNIGGTSPICHSYLGQIRELMKLCKTASYSDHLCFCEAGGHQSYDLLPIIRNRSELRRIADRVNEVQDILGVPLALENVSSYLCYEGDTLSEGEFLGELHHLTACRVLLDVNNVFVSAHNHGFDPLTELRRYPSEGLSQYHMGGHEVQGSLLIDTHRGKLSSQVIQLLGQAIAIHGERTIIFERDDDLPIEAALEELARIERGLEAPVRPWQSPSIVEFSPAAGVPNLDPDSTYRGLLTSLQEQARLGGPQSTDSSGPGYAVYQESYFQLISGHALNTVLAPLGRCFSQDLMRRLLWEYFCQHPPEHRQLDQDLTQLPEFLRCHYHELEELVEGVQHALAYHSISIAEDWQQGHLSTCDGAQLGLHSCCYKLVSRFGWLDFFDGQSELPEDQSCQGLLYKTPGPGGPVASISLPTEGRRLLDQLFQGKSIAELAASPEILASYSEVQFAELLARLSPALHLLT